MPLLIKFVAMPLYPVGLALTLGIIGIVCVFLRKKAAILFLIASFVILLIFSTPAIAQLLMQKLEKPFYNAQIPQQCCSTMVVLGGSGVPMSKPRIFPEVNSAGDRIIHTYRLFKMGFSPRIITTGTQVGSFSMSIEEAVHNALLLGELGVDSSAIIRELRARNTHEHAPNIAKILDSLGLPHEIILVTTASHMKRSIKVFEKYGYTIHPAATDFRTNAHFFCNIYDFFPTMWALETSTTAIHEYYGIIGYRLLGWI